MSKKLIAVLLCLMMVFVFASCGSSGGGGDAEAEFTFPEETVNIICPYSAGGGTDLLARAVSSNIQLDNGQAMIVTNIEGSNGLTGSYELKNSEPDGYNLAIVAPEAWVGQILTGAIDEDLARILTPVCQLCYDPDCIAVAASSPWQTFDDLIEYAKTAGKDFKIASNTKGGSNEMFCYGLFMETAGVEFTYVPYDGSAQSRTAALSGECDCVMQQVPDLLALCEAGELRALGTAGAERCAAMPDVPTFVEQGYDCTMGLHRYLWVPTDTPEEVVAYLADKCHEAMESDAAQETLATLGYSYAFESDPQTLKDTIEGVFASLEIWQEIMAENY